MTVRRTLPLLLGPSVVLAAAPSPTASWHGLLSTTYDPTGPVLHLVALAAWACAAWLFTLVLATWLAEVPGELGAVARVAARCLAPTATRTALRLALGAAVLSTGATGTALADGGGPVLAPAPAPAPASWDWPGLAPAAKGAVRGEGSPPLASPSLPTELPHPSTQPLRAAPSPPSTPSPRTTPSRPAETGPSSSIPAAAHPADIPRPDTDELVPPVDAPAGTQVVVRPGDSLWGLAERALGGHASAARVAAAWPAWWQANRAVIGDNPDLIQPGSHLTTPSTNAHPAPPPSPAP